MEYLEENLTGLNTDVNSLYQLVLVLEGHDNIVSVVPNADGSYTIFFKNQDPITLHNGSNGRNGRNGVPCQVSIQQANDGYWYWTINGDWLLDANGKRVRANGQDGRNGVDGQDSNVDPSTLIVPQMRINETTRHWEISNDGGVTWIDTGVVADGRDGTDGADGTDGTATEFFKNVVISEDGTYVTITLYDDRVLTFPIK